MGRRAMVEVSGLVAVAALFFGREAEAAVEGVQVQGTEVAGPGTRDPEVARMWQELEGAIEQGLPLALHTGSSNTTKFAMTPTTDCKGRLLAYEFAKNLQPTRSQLPTFDALELQTCQITRPTPTPRVTRVSLPRHATPSNTFHVCGSTGDDGDAGTEEAPFRTVEAALAATRRLRPLSKVIRNPGSIVLKAGVHFLADTMELGPADSGLTITGPPVGQGDAWLSGGIPLKTKWTKHRSANASWNIWVTDLDGVPEQGFTGLNTLVQGTDDFRRVTRARYPNADPSEGAELCTRCWANGVKHWHKDLSCVGKASTVYIDLRDCDNNMKLPDGSPCKNDSAMWDTYNTYTNGHGGCCAPWSGDDSPYGPMGNYFCGNASAGGWVGFDDPRGNNRSQGLSPALPYGFDYNATDTRSGGDFLQTVQDAAGAVMHVWRAQGWFVNMFEVASHDPTAQSYKFATMESRGVTHVKGGWQGGRGWQVNASAINSTEYEYLLAGKWMIENIMEALDTENEWFFNTTERKLYLWPNSTSSAPPRDTTYVATNLTTLIKVVGTMDNPVKNITIQGLNFRDGADITMLQWGVPSGGDSAAPALTIRTGIGGLYRGGAIFFEGAEDCSVRDSLFKRLDGNGVFVSGYTRRVEIDNNEFVWQGCSAMAGWGYTKENDGTDGQQPRFTKITGNYVHEIGHFEKQSSMWFQAKTCQSIIERNINFNGPRAGINLNDGFGGGTNISRNLIFNQCRESGDHGPINSWDRTAYISDLKTGEPSYRAVMNNVANNMIIANYGASQGFDTDDGSSFYDIHDNFFWMADGWKMDYGGHDSKFNDNIIYRGRPGGDGQNCVNSWPFLPGYGTEYARNKCIMPKDTNIGNLFHGCDCPGNAPGNNTGQSECGINFHDNSYYTMNGSAFINCAKPPLPLEKWQKTGSAAGDTANPLPTDDEMMEWAREKLGL